jgi:hypothetical protein
MNICDKLIVTLLLLYLPKGVFGSLLNTSKAGQWKLQVLLFSHTTPVKKANDLEILTGFAVIIIIITITIAITITSA